MTAARARKYLDEGLQVQRQGDVAGAANAFRKAMDEDAAWPLARHRYGAALCELGQIEVGLNLMRTAIRDEPANAASHADLARVLMQRKPDEALEHWAIAAHLAPNDVETRLGHARQLLQMGHAEDAVPAFESARRLAPNRSDIPRVLSELHYAANRIEAALECYESALKLRPALAQTLRLGAATPRPPTDRESVLRLSDVRRCSLPDDAALQAAVSARDLHVIDDFLDDPQAYRAAALAAPFQTQQYAGQNYPGLQTAGVACPALMQRIADVLGRPIKYISPDNGALRISFADSTARGDIHVDSHPGRGPAYAGVLYLNPPEQCRGGTVFWRHVETGWAQRPVASALAGSAYESAADFHRRCLPRDSAVPFAQLQSQREDWSPVFEVPMASNRLIVYRGDWYHSISEVFGNTLDDGRLVQLFFFELAG